MGAMKTEETVEGMEDDCLTEAGAGGVRAVETGIRLLSSLILLGPRTKLKTLAEQSGMPPPKAHRYLTSYCRAGLVEQDGKGGGYRLGPLALQLGLAALRHLDVANLAGAILAQLRDETGLTCALAVWGSFGPTFVRVEESNDLVVTTTRPGTVLPILHSSTGKIFGAYLPRKLTAPILDQELKGRGRLSRQLAEPPKTLAQAEALFEQVRRDGVACNNSAEYHRGINALAAPIFDHNAHLVAAVTLWGEAGVIDTRIDGPVARLLLEKTRLVSRQLSMN